MIRITIVADTLSRARSLADRLAEDELIDIVDTRVASRDLDYADAHIDLIVTTGLAPDQIPRAGVPVVMVGDGPAQRTLFAREVRAWLPSTSSASELSAAISAAAQDLAILTQDQVKEWLRTTERHTDEDVFVEALTPRELQVLRMLGEGLVNKEIAGRLGISEHTAKFHVAQILAKLGASSRAEAVALGMRRGLVPI